MVARSAVDEVVDGIRNLIATGQLPPGARLPPEAALAESFGLSRTSVREGVRALTTAHVLQVRRGDGTFVTSLEPALLFEGIGFAVDLLREEYTLDLLETRRLIEPEAVAIAASRISGAQLHHLRTTLQAMRAAESHSDFVTLDAEFHDLINLASGNPVLAALIRSVSRPSQRARVWRDILESGATTQTLTEHQEILDALTSRDPLRAHAAALSHVRTTETWLAAMVEPSD